MLFIVIIHFLGRCQIFFNVAIPGTPCSIGISGTGHADKIGYLDGDLPVNRRCGEISDDEPIRAIDKLTFDHGESRINGRPLVLKSFSWVLAGGQFSGEGGLDSTAESL